MTKSSNKRSTFLALFNVFLLAVILAVVATTARTKTCNCAVCDRPVFVLSYLEQHVGPFKDIPAIHPTCAVYLKEFLAPNAGQTISEWLKYRGYYLTPDQLKNVGVSTIANDYDANATGYNPVTGEDYFTE